NVRQEQLESPYREWFEVSAFDDPETEENEFRYDGGGADGTWPVWRRSEGRLDEGASQYLFDAMARWLDPDGNGDPGGGVDGWRVEDPETLPISFWHDWNTHVRTVDPEAYTLCVTRDAPGDLI